MPVTINLNYNPLIGFNNPLIYENSGRYLKTELENETVIKNFFDISAKVYKSIDKELKKMSETEFITVDNYLTINKNVLQNNKKDLTKFNSILFKNQDYFIDHLYSTVNTLYSIISDEYKVAKRLNMEKDIIKRVHLSSVIDIQKTLLLELRNELEKSRKKKAGTWAKIPIFNKIFLVMRLIFFKKMERSAAATNIVALRMTKFFDKDKIKREIDQAYGEFAKAGIIKSSRNYDEYNKYLSGIIKS